MEWNDLFLAMAFILAQKSKDESTKCGAIIVDKHNRIVSGGFNGPSRGTDDELVPQTRPEKYLHMLHAEINSIIFAKKDLEGAKCIVTNKCCHPCLNSLIQAGVKQIIFPSINKAKMIDEMQEEAIRFTLSQHPEVEVRELDLDGAKDIMEAALKSIVDLKEIGVCQEVIKIIEEREKNNG